METNLRPLTLGEILDRTAELYRSNFLLLAGISSIYSGLLLVLAMVQIGVQRAFSGTPLNAYLIAGAVIGILLILLLSLVSGGVAVAANTRAVGWLHLGEPATIRTAYSAILPRARRFVWLITLIYFLAWFPCFVVYAAYAVLLFYYIHTKGLLTPHGAPTMDQASALVLVGASAVFVFLLLAFGIYGVIMTLRYSLAVPACAVEDLKPRAAIRRSVQLSKGSRGRIFLLGLLTLIIQLGLTGITQGTFIVLQLRHKEGLPLWVSVLQQLFAFLTNTFVGPIYATGFTLFYYDQRVRKEGFDIEHMMHAAGMMELPPPMETPAAVETMASAESGSVHE